MKIKWLGQASFVITSSAGTRIRTDPFDPSLGFPGSDEEADIVTVSHAHFDHAAVDVVKGNPTVIRAVGTHEVRGITFVGIPSYHDKSKGSERGENIIFCFQVDGVRLCHLGDLGHLLAGDELQQMSEVGVLFIPVGGTYTIDADEATQVMKQLSPRITIPMHYKAGALTLPIAGVDPFLSGKSHVETHKELEVNADSLPSTQGIVVLTPVGT